MSDSRRHASALGFFRACRFAAAVLVVFAGASQAHAGTYTPLGVSGYTFDGVAESPPAAAHTSDTFDGTYVLYARSYGAMVGSSRGLPDEGRIVREGGIYQLQPYDANNVLRVNAGESADLVLDEPTYLGAISLLGFAVQGDGAADIRLHFDDGTEKAFDAVPIPDWFTGDNAVLAGFDRMDRSSDVPANVGVEDPRMYAFDLVQGCAGVQRPVERISIQNVSQAQLTQLSFMALSAQSADEAMRIEGVRIVTVLQVASLMQSLPGGAWSSSDPSVAVVFPIDDGRSVDVAALRTGATTVTYSCGPERKSTQRIVVVPADSLFYDDFDG